MRSALLSLQMTDILWQNDNCPLSLLIVSL
uniref:Uncharacterized protein n=1 Tax=Arundo donax TaxID=35708 RepID=A0A0A9FUQ5_ARUDO